MSATIKHLDIKTNQQPGLRKNDLHYLLDTHNYDELIQLLRDRQTAGQSDENRVLESLIAATIQISVACAEAQDEVNWHDKALSNARQRQNLLSELLGRILDCVENPAERPALPPLILPGEAKDTSDLDGDELESAHHYRLWQRFQSLFRPHLDIVRDQVLPPHVEDAALTTLAALTVLIDRQESQPVLVAYCLGPFEIAINDRLITDLGSRKGKLIFKYLLLHREQRIPKEMLMDTFWPDAEPAAARNNLNVAIYSLRRALHTDDSEFSHILYEDDFYFLNPEMTVWADFEKFLEYAESGKQLEYSGEITSAFQHFSAAETIYHGRLLEEDLYEDWLSAHREMLQNTYLDILERIGRYYFERRDFAACIHMCSKILQVDPCREDAHRRLMQCYTEQGQHYLALRQYHLCADSLRKELDTIPSPQLEQLYQEIRRKTTL